MRRSGLVLGGLLAAFLLGEALVRIVVGTDSIPMTPLGIAPGRYVAHPFLPFTGVPRADYTLDDTGADGVTRYEHIRNNAHGYRTHDFPETKGPNDFFVVCLGGSTTYGRRVESNEKTWPGLLEAKLAAAMPDKNVRVFNLGMDRATSAVSVVNFALAGVHVEPDVVVVYHGYNDLAAMGREGFRSDHAHFFRDFSPERVWRGVQRSIPPWMLRSALVSFVASRLDVEMRINDLAAEIGVDSAPADDPLVGIEATLQNFVTIDAMARGRGGRALLTTFQFRDGDDPVYRRYNERLRAFYRERGLPFADIDAALPDHDDTINTDPCHFTPLGRERMADEVFDEIVRQGWVR